MAYEQKVNSGSLFRNDKKTQDTHPTHTGSINVEGVEYWLNAWTNEVKSGPKAGKKYFKLSVKRKEQSAAPGPGPDEQADEIDDDVPF